MISLSGIVNAAMAAYLGASPVSRDYRVDIYFKSNSGENYSRFANCDHGKECSIRFGYNFVFSILPGRDSYEVSLQYFGDDPIFVRCCQFSNGRSHTEISGTGKTQTLTVKNATPRDLAYHPSKTIGELSVTVSYH